MGPFFIAFPTAGSECIRVISKAVLSGVTSFVDGIFFLSVFETESHMYMELICIWNSYVYHVGLTEICLPLPIKCWN